VIRNPFLLLLKFEHPAAFVSEIKILPANAVCGIKERLFDFPNEKGEVAPDRPGADKDFSVFGKFWKPCSATGCPLCPEQSKQTVLRAASGVLGVCGYIPVWRVLLRHNASGCKKQRHSVHIVHCRFDSKKVLKGFESSVNKGP
jgi:hypothetical protein